MTAIDTIAEEYVPSAQEARAARIALLSERLKEAAERLQYEEVFVISSEIDAIATEIKAVLG